MTTEPRYRRFHAIEVVGGTFICRDCGSIVFDPEAHDRHHQATDRFNAGDWADT